jgi:hypothetical protein
VKEFYWLYKNKKYESKAKALADAKGDNSAISYYFMDDVLDSCNFQIEPSDSWRALCRKRAKQIRENYDYVCLWFSGGWDSTEMLWSFVESGCKVDEIIIFDRTYMIDTEIPPAINFAKKIIKDHFQQCVLNVINIDHNWNGSFYEAFNDDWLFESGATGRFSKNSRKFLTERHPEILKNRKQLKGKIVDVQATDKPKLHIYENNWYAFQLDVVCSLLIGSKFELFYFSSDAPELYIKSCHMAKTYFESNDVVDNDTVHKIQGSSSGSQKYADWNMAIGRRGACGSDAYLGNQKFITLEKGNNLETEKLRKFYHDNNKKIYNAWSENLKSFGNCYNLDLFNETLPKSFSKSYLIGPVKKKN